MIAHMAAKTSLSSENCRRRSAAQLRAPLDQRRWLREARARAVGRRRGGSGAGGTMHNCTVQGGTGHWSMTCGCALVGQRQAWLLRATGRRRSVARPAAGGSACCATGVRCVRGVAWRWLVHQRKLRYGRCRARAPCSPCVLCAGGRGGAAWRLLRVRLRDGAAGG